MRRRWASCVVPAGRRFREKAGRKFLLATNYTSVPCWIRSWVWDDGQYNIGRTWDVRFRHVDGLDRLDQSLWVFY
jgi:hypothetical protein